MAGVAVGGDLLIFSFPVSFPKPKTFWETNEKSTNQINRLWDFSCSLLKGEYDDAIDIIGSFPAPIGVCAGLPGVCTASMRQMHNGAAGPGNVC
jgi:hypothetical protein